MLSRRLLRQLADNFLPHPRSATTSSICFASRCAACPPCRRTLAIPTQRHATSASSSSVRWKSRQSKDPYAKEAKVRKWKSRAAFKLLELNAGHKLFKPGQTIVDLGFAPGSWSQVAVTETAPNGRVVGIDLIPAQPPRGVSTIQGDFLSPSVQADVRAYVQDPDLGRPRRSISSRQDGAMPEDEVEELERGYIDIEKRAHLDAEEPIDPPEGKNRGDERLTLKERDERLGRVVDVVLSDMSEPWDQVSGFHIRSLSDPYNRLMNTTGIPFKDHAGSMDLCLAALNFSFDTLRTNGHFVCKFYQGAEDRAFETKLKRLFEKVHREKPESSRNQSKEAYFVALKRKAAPTKEEVFRE
ncbi:FtsJ-domain-containing protein [Massarina eburnea CBS 473.64]|uniref:rRNA methyltransferase 2, mitochondrial n=1 Tax=Massarina eburnea CBS 473.64 TaxID=1395130 RepID=A0A6A6RYH8_9PLEO|nr:FtsJ-domain-containing protein [Massarina eburnea CBS 473.64]